MKNRCAGFSAGLCDMVTACFLFSVMSACVYEAKVLDPEVPASVVSFVRVAVNLAILIIPAMFIKRGVRELFGDFSLSLWVRGFAGGISLMLFFFAVQMIGAGEGTLFMQSTSGLFIVLFAPLVLPEKFSPKSFIAVCGSIFGLYLLFDPKFGAAEFMGKTIAIAAGLFGAFSNLAVARAGKKNTAECIVFYFCFVSLFVHIPYFSFFPASVPTGKGIWAAMVGAGIAASFAQIYMSRAFQKAPAALVSAVSYLTPIFALGWSILLFGDVPTKREIIGCAIVLVFGIMLPFFRERRDGKSCAIAD